MSCLVSSFKTFLGINRMKCQVQLYVAGTVFYETVIAKDYKEAKEVALARNPNAKVIAVTAKFN